MKKAYFVTVRLEVEGDDDDDCYTRAEDMVSEMLDVECFDDVVSATSKKLEEAE